MIYIVYYTTNVVNKKFYIGVHECTSSKFDGYQWSLEKLTSLENIEVKCVARKVGQYDLNGNLIKVFNTVTECRKEFSGCRNVLSGKYKTSGGYIFKYIE